MSGASKILMGSGGVDLPSDDEFNRVSFLSHFDGSNNGTNIVYDDGSASDHTISVTGNPTQGTFGPFARPDGQWSNYFDGTGDYFDISSSSDFEYGTGDFTWECFFFLTIPIAHSNYIISQGVLGYAPALYVTSAGHLEFKDWVSGGTDIDQRIADDVTINEWHHVAISRASGTASFYYDGTRAATVTGTSNFPGSAGVRIGNYSEGGSYEFGGYLSNIRIVKGTAVYSGTSITVPTSALTAISGTVLLTCRSNRFVDKSTSAHTLTATGTPRASAFTPFLTSKAYAAGTNGASAFFVGDGTATSIDVDATGSDFAYGTGDFTIEGWFYNDGNGAGAPFVYSQGNMMQFYMSPPNFNFYIKDAETGSVVVNSSTTLGLVWNEWNHWAVSRSGSNLSVFINGVRAITDASASNTFSAASGGGYKDYMHLGNFAADTGTYPFGGYQSDFRILKGTALYDPTSSTCTVPTAPLTAITNTVLLLNMADGQALDSAAQNNMTLFGTADTSTTQQKFGTASLFLEGDSDTDFALLAGSADLSGPFTIECWARAADTDNAWLWCNGAYTIELGLNGDNVQLYGTGFGGNFFTGGEFTVNTWHHLALVRDTSNVIKCYLNGTVSGTTFSNAYTAVTFAATSGFIIGGEYASATSISHGWDGYVDEFRISNFVRYTDNFTPSTEAFPDKGQ